MWSAQSLRERTFDEKRHKMDLSAQDWRAISAAYGIDHDIETQPLLIGTALCFRTLGDKSYFVKISDDPSIRSEMEKESAIRQQLIGRGFPTIPILPTRDGDSVLIVNGKVVQVQDYLDGSDFPVNSMRAPQTIEMAQLLVKCVRAMSDVSGIPEYHYASWFSNTRFDDIRTRFATMLTSSALARHQDGPEIRALLTARLALLDEIESFTFEHDAFLRCKSHGDFNCLQIVATPYRGYYLTDFIRVGILPVCWEIIRSFTISAVSSANAKIDFSEFRAYCSVFAQNGLLPAYDRGAMVDLYLYQLASSTYGIWSAYQAGFDDAASLKLGIWRSKLAIYLAENGHALKEMLRDELR